MKVLKIVVPVIALLMARPQDSTADTRPEIGIQEKLGQMIPLDEPFYDEQGNTITLRQLVDKPVILTFVYFRCPGICTPLLTELSRMIDRMDLEPGKDYRVITIGFDHREPPDLARGKKEAYLGAMSRQVDPSAWRFLTADSAVIMRTTDAAGFYFKRDGNDFVHAAALIILSPEGKITRYINGIQYLPFDIKMALIEASDGRVGPTISKLLRFCYAYDPEARTYAMDVTRVGGVVVLLLVGVFVAVVVLRPRRKSTEKEKTHVTES